VFSGRGAQLRSYAQVPIARKLRGQPGDLLLKRSLIVQRIQGFVSLAKITTRSVLHNSSSVLFMAIPPCFFAVAHFLLGGDMPILIQPTFLSRDETLKGALRVLQAKGIAVGGSWFVDADVVLNVDQQDAAKAAAFLKEAGFRAIVQKSE
jgi:hypothetical protein